MMPTPPPNYWSNQDVAVLDPHRGIYLAPEGARDNRWTVLWHRCSGVGPTPRWLGTPVDEATIERRTPWTVSVLLECAACGLSGRVLDGRWVEAPTTV